MEPRDSYVMYRGFVKVLNKLPDDENLLLRKAIDEYCLNGVLPEFALVHLCIAFELMKEQFDKNLKRWENAKKGGAPRGNRNAQKKTEQPETTEINQKQANVNVNVNADVNANADVENIKVQTPAGRSDEDVQKSAPEKPEVTGKDAEKVFAILWALYPSKKGKGRISDTKKKLLAKIGVEEMTRCIERYTADLAKEPWRKPQNGSTFFNSGYIDYLDENYREADGNGKTKWNTGIQEI